MTTLLPPGSCDAHCHVFGPADEFPYDPARTYTPEDAPASALFALHAKLGISRSVIVQPGCHGFDNSVTLNAIARKGGAYRGVALVPDDVTAAHIAALDAGGMRGVRFNFMTHLGPPPDLTVFHRIVDLIAPHGWHVVLHMTPKDLAQADAYLKPLAIPFVLDHMARITTAGGVEQDGFRLLVDRMADPRALVKISGADRASVLGAPYDDALPFMRALIETAPDRVLWGTDWPHPNIKGAMPDEAVLLDLLRRAAPEDDVFRHILVDNPQRLYRFTA